VPGGRGCAGEKGRKGEGEKERRSAERRGLRIEIQKRRALRNENSKSKIRNPKFDHFVYFCDSIIMLRLRRAKPNTDYQFFFAFSIFLTNHILCIVNRKIFNDKVPIFVNIYN